MLIHIYISLWQITVPELTKDWASYNILIRISPTFDLDDECQLNLAFRVENVKES